VHLCRDRKRAGRAVLRVEVNLGALADFLIDSRFLQEWNDQDRRAIEQALEAAIDVWSRP
jgi:hypothetical protein